MQNFQTEKQLIRNFYAALDAAPLEAIVDVMSAHVSMDYVWRGFHPFHQQSGHEAVATGFWTPLRYALTKMQRRMDIFLAGQNEIDGYQSVWVISMGHLMGLFDKPWLDIPPTGKMAFLRYCEFNRVEQGFIRETALFFDIPHLMRQAGLDPFPQQTAAHLIQPGPKTHGGLLFELQDPLEGIKTRQAINAMVNDLKTWQTAVSLEEELSRTWNDDMIWWGPEGIGATYTIERYAKQHAGPFRSAFSERTFNGHRCKLSEGMYGGFFGWPNLTLTLTSDFMGFPATGKPGDMRVIDIYRREGDKLAENWIFIDMLHFWNQQGIDVLANTTRETDSAPQG